MPLDLLKEVERLAEEDHRAVGPWIKLQLTKAVEEAKRDAKKQPSKGAA